MDKTYARAYTEVSEILKFLPKEEYEKIPQEEIKFYNENSDKDYYFKINSNIPIEQQNISKEANAILVILFRDYIASELQKQKLERILKYNFVEQQKLAKEQYNSNELFKNNTENSQEQKMQELQQDNTQLVEYKKSWIKTFINKIKLLFKRK